MAASPPSMLLHGGSMGEAAAAQSCSIASALPTHAPTPLPLLDRRLLRLQAFPIHTYPQVMLLPDGGLAMSAGNLLVRCSGNTQAAGGFGAARVLPGAVLPLVNTPTTPLAGQI